MCLASYVGAHGKAEYKAVSVTLATPVTNGLPNLALKAGANDCPHQRAVCHRPF